MILCADDFGISPGVSEGILELVQDKKLTAVSCMMTEPDAERTLPSLRPFANQVDIGLHLVLTDTAPLHAIGTASNLVGSTGKFLSFSELTRRAYSGRLQRSVIFEEIKRQILKFMEIFGQFPDFIDGHQHVQQLPIIRDELINAIKSLKPAKKFYLRQASLPLKWIADLATNLNLKTAVDNYFIRWPATFWRKRIEEFGFSQNRFLLGYFTPSTGVSFDTVFNFYASKALDSRDIFFCHPGYVDPYLTQRDSLLQPREVMLRFLKSNDVSDMLRSGKLKLNRYF